MPPLQQTIDEDSNAMFDGFHFLIEKKNFIREDTIRDKSQKTIAFKMKHHNKVYMYYGQAWSNRGVVKIPFFLVSHAERFELPIIYYLKEDESFYVIYNIAKIIKWGVKNYDKSKRMEMLQFDLALGKKYIFTDESQSVLDKFIEFT